MANKLFKSLTDQNNKVDKNGFDLESRHVFSAKAGEFSPCFKLPTIISGEYSIDVKQLIRTQPIIGAPFTRIDFNYEFAYVDYNHLYSGYNEFVAQREDNQTSVDIDVEKFPYISRFDGLLYWILFGAVYDSLVCRLALTFDDTNYDSDSISQLFAAFPSNAPWTSCFLSAVRMLDMFGYTNLVPYVNALTQLHYERFQQLYPTNQSFSDFMDYLTGDYLTNMKVYLTQYVHFNEVPVNVAWWPILAYNKVWAEYKRNSIYDNEYTITNMLGDIQPFTFKYSRLFNVDDCSGIAIADFSAYIPGTTDFANLTLGELVGSTFGETAIPRVLAMLTVKPVPYGKDMFSGVLPSTQFGDVSMMVEDNVWKQLLLNDRTNTDGVAATFTTSQETSGGLDDALVSAYNLPTPRGTNVYVKFNPAVAISVLSERRANALQRFSERMLRAGSKTDDNFRAHWGFSPKSYNDMKPQFLGAFDGSLDINTVAATTSNGEGQELGQLGGNGIAVVQGSKIKFTSTGFGIVIGCFYASKPSEYDNYGLDRHNQLLDVWDVPYPELMNISLAPVDVITLNYLGARNFDERILGYLPRFIEHKTAVDLIHGEFYSSLPWKYSIGGTDFTTEIPYTTRGVFSNMVTPRDSYGFVDDVSWLYINPNSLDNIFTLKANQCQYTDPFFVNCLFDVMAVQPLSVLGLPQ